MNDISVSVQGDNTVAPCTLTLYLFSLHPHHHIRFLRQSECPVQRFKISEIIQKPRIVRHTHTGNIPVPLIIFPRLLHQMYVTRIVTTILNIISTTESISKSLISLPFSFNYFLLSHFIFLR